MRTDELIQQLSRRSHPVKRLAPQRVRLLRWLGAVLFCIGAGILVVGIRSDIGEVLGSPAYLLHTVLIFVVGILSAAAALSLSVPNQNLSSRMKFVPFVALGGWLSYLLIALLTGSGGFVGLGLFCVRDILLLAIPPGALLFVMIARSAPVELRLTGVFLALSVAAFGAFGTQLTCKNDEALHVLVWHFVPVLLMGGLGAALARLLGRWDRRHWRR